MQHRHEGRTHDGKLQQMFGGAVHIGPQIEHGGAAALEVGHLPRDGWAVNAVHGLEHITGNRHQGPGVARRHGHLRLAIAHLLNGHTHGGVFFLAQGYFQRIVHLDHLGGHHHLSTRVRKTRQGLSAPHENQPGIRVSRQKTATGRQRDAGTVVAAHAVDRHGDRGGRGHDILGLKTGINAGHKPKSPRLLVKVAPGL